MSPQSVELLPERPELPPEENPEYHATGRFSASVVRPVVRDDARRLLVAPGAFPWDSLIALHVIIGLFFGGVCLLVTLAASGGSSGPPEPALVIGTGLFTSVVFTLVVACGNQYERNRGPWLEYDKAARRLVLPRHGVAVPLEDVVRLQLVRAGRLPERTQIQTEVQLIAYQGGERKRWQVLDAIRDLEKLLAEVQQRLPVEIRRIEQSLWDGAITVTPFQPRLRPFHYSLRSIFYVMTACAVLSAIAARLGFVGLLATVCMAPVVLGGAIEFFHGRRLGQPGRVRKGLVIWLFGVSVAGGLLLAAILQ